MCNPLGTARGDHKECGVQTATLNLPPVDRFTTDNIMLTALAKASVYKVHGMARVLCGVDSNGVQHDEPSYAADMTELDLGRDIFIPDDKGGEEKLRLRVWCMIFSGDYLGCQSVLPFVESPSAFVFCRTCEFDTRAPDAHRPLSFLSDPQTVRERCWDTLKEVIAKLHLVTSAKKLKAAFQKHGLNKLIFALDPDYVPHVRPMLIAPQDNLHLFPDGLLRSELAWVIYIFCKKYGLSLDRLNARVRAYKGLPKDVRIPRIREKIKKGMKGGIPDSASTVRMTGSQCMHFTLHSHDIFCGGTSPLLTHQMQADPAWRSWLKLTELYTKTIQHKLHVSDVEVVDDLQLEYSKLFDAVPEYNGLKRPKHHFLSHLALDLWRFGPGRGYWCFGFEAFNRVIKGGANCSNWKNTTVSIMRYWSARSARAFSKV